MLSVIASHLHSYNFCICTSFQVRTWILPISSGAHLNIAHISRCAPWYCTYLQVRTCILHIYSGGHLDMWWTSRLVRTLLVAPSLLHLARCRPLHLGLCAVIALFAIIVCHRHIEPFLGKNCADTHVTGVGQGGSILGVWGSCNALSCEHIWILQIGKRCKSIGAKLFRFSPARLIRRGRGQLATAALP